jgi:hypothetical protein
MFGAWPQNADARACRWPMQKTILLAAQHAAVGADFVQLIMILSKQIERAL